MQFPIHDKEKELADNTEMLDTLSILMLTAWEILLCPLAIFLLGGAIFTFQLLLWQPTSNFPLQVLQVFLQHKFIAREQLLFQSSIYLLLFLCFWVTLSLALSFFQNNFTGLRNSLSRIPAIGTMAIVSTLFLVLNTFAYLLLLRVGLLQLGQNDDSWLEKILLGFSGIMCLLFFCTLGLCSLLATSRLAVWEEEVATPWEGLTALWTSWRDLISLSVFRLALILSLLAVVNIPIIAGAIYLMLRYLQTTSYSVGFIFMGGQSLLIAFAILWSAEGLRRTSDDLLSHSG